MADNSPTMLSATESRPTMCSGGWRGMVDAGLHHALAARLGAHLDGQLKLVLPSGRVVLAGGQGGIDARLMVKSYAAIWRVLLRGHIGFAESYMNETIDTDDLEGVFALFLANQHRLISALPGVLASARRDRRFHARRANTRFGSRRNIAAHYDLGNAFYEQWLDAGLTYSSGIYARSDITLEEAQQAKYARILAALDLAPGHKVLEIGCGWGAMAEQLGRAGADVTAITISRQQHDAATERIAAAGLADRVKVEFRDYRDTAGDFDRIVSVEMIEAVGEENWPAYFDTVKRRLRPGGRAVIQAITIKDDLYDDYRRNPDFIQRYIFPGGMLPTVRMLQQQGTAGGLAFTEIERFGGSYARTLGDWQRRFRAGWPKIEAMGFDARFRRMWEYYLAYCKVGFERGTIDVGLYQFERPRSGSSDRDRVA
jgi:cyclopropane-fatty-acyl-phospholipid synthase